MLTLSFERPDNTDQYEAGDVVGVTGNAAAVSAALPSLIVHTASRLVRCGLARSQATATDAAFQLVVCSERPTLTGEDEDALAGAFSHTIVGVLEVAVADQRVLADGAFGTLVDVAGDGVGLVLDEGTYTLILVANDTYTPEAEEVFTLTPQLIPLR